MHKILALRTRTVFVFSFVVILILSTGSARTAAAPEADLLLLNSRVVTVDKTWSSVHAVAVRGQRIAWMGSDEEARSLYASALRIIDLHGATVLPDSSMLIRT
jgi:hypothetical protein